jgi:hypothetical protein
VTDLALKPVLAALDAVYAAAQDPEHWSTALDRIASVVRAPGATLGYFEIGATHVEFARSSVLSRENIDYYKRELAPVDPITPLVQDVPVGVSTLSHEVLDPRVWTDSRMYAELYQPHRMLHAMAGTFMRERDRFGTLIVMQDQEGSSFARPHAELLDLLLPHVARSIQISRLLAAARSESEVSSRLAAVFLDHRGDVLAVGPRAEALLRRCTRLTLEDRRLRSTDARIERWLASLAPTEAGEELAQRALALAGHGGPLWLDDPAVRVRLEAVACPEPLLSWTSPGAQPATIILLEPGHPGGDLPASLCEVAELLAEGLSDKQIAERSGRPVSTVRTYVARLYQRTGLRSRAALTKWWWTRD